MIVYQTINMMCSYRVETVEVLYSYTYNDYDDVFERSPLIVHIKDLTPTRTYVATGYNITLNMLWHLFALSCMPVAM